MRNTIRGKRNRVKKDRLITFLAFFVVAPLISIILGFAIVKFLIIPTFLTVQDEMDHQTDLSDINNDTIEFEQKELETSGIKEDLQTEPTQLKQSKIEGLTLYNVQVGNFSSEENANNLIMELNSKGMPGYLIKGESYKVFAGTYLAREEAESYLLEVKTLYNDAFINTFTLQERVITYNEDEENIANILIEVISSIDNAYKEELDLWHKALKENEGKLLLDEITSNSNNLRAQIIKVNTELKSEQLIQLDKDLKNYISGRENIITDLNNEQKSLNQCFNEYNESYYKYLNFIK